jgi:hypothetical protein
MINKLYTFMFVAFSFTVTAQQSSIQYDLKTIDKVPIQKERGSINLESNWKWSGNYLATMCMKKHH